jgi:transketolase
VLIRSSLNQKYLIIGGLGEAVAGALSEEKDIRIRRLAVNQIPRSGPAQGLIDMFGIGAKAIVEAAVNLVK